MKASLSDVRRAIEGGGDVRLFLLYGPDEAGAAEVQQMLARRLGSDAERVDIEPGQLKARPGLLADEAAAMSLFGTPRYIRVSGIGDESVEAVTLLLAAERAGNPVIAFGPTLKATAKVMKTAQGSPRAMTLACYVPSGRDAEQLVRTIAGEHGLRLAGGVAKRLAAATGGDRALMAREVEKLALYVDADRDRPGEADDAALTAIGADLGDPEIGGAVDALVAGQPDRLGQELDRLAEGGVDAIPLLRGVVRRLTLLAELRGEIDRGAQPDKVLERVFWRDRAAMGQALRLWPLPALAVAIARARQAERGYLAPASAGGIVAQHTLAGLARDAARRR